MKPNGRNVPKGTNHYKSLLDIRKALKRAKCNEQQAQSHLGFLHSCGKEKKTPKGLRLKASCHAFLARTTDVRDLFDKVIKETEEKLTSLLMEHYEVVVDVATEKICDLETEIAPNHPGKTDVTTMR